MDKSELMKFIEQNILKMSGSKHPTEVFDDWVMLSAIAISNSVFFDKKREEQYLSIIGKYKEKEKAMLSDMLGALTLLFDIELDDYLGKLYMKIDRGGNGTGQFFTPYHLSELCAMVSSSDYKGEDISVEEPSCGAGGMIIGLANALKKKGYNYQGKMNVDARDLDFRCVYMCYVQLSLTGISARCIQGNTLGYEENTILYTPMYVLNGSKSKENKNETNVCRQADGQVRFAL